MTLEPDAPAEELNDITPPADRRQLALETKGKTSRWPRTSRRTQRLTEVLQRRQPDLTIVLENVHDPHNIAAVLRTADAVGLLDIHLVYTFEDVPKAFARSTSAGSGKWLNWTLHESIESCYQALADAGMKILATALKPGGSDLYGTNLTQPTAIVFGNEMRGLSQDAIELADATMYIPMTGMVESLNISVSCAVTLFEAFRQRRALGCYDHQSLADEQFHETLAAWLEK
jgi:tRNA (guanosine-2'-O-)-methyltransferase